MTYRHLLLAVFTISLALTIAGCGNSPVATVGGVKITDAEFNDRLVKTYGEDLLRTMIDRELIRQAAADRDIQISDEEMADELAKAKLQAGPEEAFQQFLTENDLTEEQWEEEVRIMVLAKRLALQGVEPTDAELQAFFEQNKMQFAQPATVSFNEIVVSSSEDAAKVQEELAAGDASFADLASRYSVSTSRESGGEMPEVPVDRIGQPQIKQIAESLPVGEVSDTIEVNGSWVILKVRDRTAGREASFETDRERIEEQYKMANANSVRDILDEQAKSTTVTIVDPRLSGLNADYTAMPDEIPQFGTEDTAPADGEPLPEAPAAPDAE